MMTDKTFLLVDDATFIRTMLKDVIEEIENYHVIGEAKNGREAIEQAALLQPDVMTIDITMPEVDGIEAIPEIVKKSPNTKIIVVSAMGNREQVLKALKCGASEFVVKPFDKTRVIAAIYKVLSEDSI